MGHNVVYMIEKALKIRAGVYIYRNYKIIKVVKDVNRYRFNSTKLIRKTRIEYWGVKKKKILCLLRQ